MLRLFKRRTPQSQRQWDLAKLRELYWRLSQLGHAEPEIRSILSKINKIELRFSIERLFTLQAMNARLSLHVDTRWIEAVACYGHGLFNAAIAMASASCEVRLGETLGYREGTYGQMLEGNYDNFVNKNGNVISPELWNLHMKMVKDYRNPYVHIDMETLATKRDIATAGPPDFTRYYVGKPRLHDEEHAFFDRLALEYQEDSPAAAANEALNLACTIFLRHNQETPTP